MQPHALPAPDSHACPHACPFLLFRLVASQNLLDDADGDVGSIAGFGALASADTDRIRAVLGALDAVRARAGDSTGNNKPSATSSSSSASSSKKPKDPNAPKRPPTAYTLFCQAARAECALPSKHLHPSHVLSSPPHTNPTRTRARALPCPLARGRYAGMAFTDQSKALGEAWKALSDGEKVEYEQAAKDAKARVPTPPEPLITRTRQACQLPQRARALEREPQHRTQQQIVVPPPSSPPAIPPHILPRPLSP